MFYAPQQNDTFERKHRQLLDIARSLLIHANLPSKFLGDCILTATFLINKLLTTNLNWKSPFEMPFHHSLNISHLQNIGCLVYAAALGPFKTSDKFAPKDRKLVFVDYPPNQKRYKFYDLDNHQVFLSRDVLFFSILFLFMVFFRFISRLSIQYCSFHFTF